MKNVLRLVLVLFTVLGITLLTGLSLFRMLYPKNRIASVTTTELKFSGAYRPLSSDSSTVSQVYEQANPAVVRVTATHILREDEDDEEVKLPKNHPEVDRRSRGVGTGCIIDENGYIVTNQHVVDQADQVRVRLIDNSELPARVIGEDKTTDLALLKVELPAKLTVMPLGDSGLLHIGEPVIAIGNPYSYDRTVTTGVVSAKGRKVFNTIYEDYIQTDAAINVGNSGGPLLNMSGELVGINTVIRADANGISFAIPVNQVKQIMAQLKKQGRVVRGFLGIQPDTITSEVRDALGLTVNKGALVTVVNGESAAARAGIEIYDVIVKFNGKDVENKDDLYRMIAETPPGLDVEIELIRDHTHKNIVVRLTEREEVNVSAIPSKNPLKKVSFGRTGFVVKDRDSKDNMMFHVQNGSSKSSGVVISEIDPLSSAADAGLQSGFVIMEVNRKPVHNAADFETIVAKMKDGDALLMRIVGSRDGLQPYFIAAIRLGQ